MSFSRKSFAVLEAVALMKLLPLPGSLAGFLLRRSDAAKRLCSSLLERPLLLRETESAVLLAELEFCRSTVRFAVVGAEDRRFLGAGSGLKLELSSLETDLDVVGRNRGVVFLCTVLLVSSEFTVTLFINDTLGHFTGC